MVRYQTSSEVDILRFTCALVFLLLLLLKEITVMATISFKMKDNLKLLMCHIFVSFHKEWSFGPLSLV